MFNFATVADISPTVADFSTLRTHSLQSLLLDICDTLKSFHIQNCCMLCVTIYPTRTRFLVEYRLNCMRNLKKSRNRSTMNKVITVPLLPPLTQPTNFEANRLPFDLGMVRPDEDKSGLSEFHPAHLAGE